MRVREEDLEAYVQRDVRSAPDSDADGSERRNWRPFTMDDPLWDIVGMIDNPEGDTWVSGDKHRALAEAYMPKP